MESRLGRNNPSWKNYTEKERWNHRIRPGRDNWKKQMHERDNYTCQVCFKNRLNKIKGNCQAHHIESYSKNKNLRTDVNNGITLCKFHHNLYHRRFGKNATKVNFRRFILTEKTNA